MDKRIALVTGANRGIGFEVSRQLAGKGIYVLLTSRDDAKGKAAAQRLSANGLDVTHYQLDVPTKRASNVCANLWSKNADGSISW